MVQISTFALVAALSAAPILAAPLTQLIEDGIATRDLGLSDKIQLEVREPFLHKITKVMPSFRRDLNDLDAREFEAFEVNIARDFADEYSGSIAPRDFDEAQLNARSPFIKKILGGIGRIFGFRRNLEELSARELEAFEDTFTRAFDEYRSSNIASRDVNDAQLRIRAPIIGKIFGGIKKIFGFRRDLDELNARELEAFEDIVTRAFEGDSGNVAARDFDDTQLDVRSPWKRLVGPGGRILGGFPGFRRDLDVPKLNTREVKELEDVISRALDEYASDFVVRNIDVEDVDARYYLDFEDLEARDTDELD